MDVDKELCEKVCFPTTYGMHMSAVRALSSIHEPIKSMEFENIEATFHLFADETGSFGVSFSGNTALVVTNEGALGEDFLARYSRLGLAKGE